MIVCFGTVYWDSVNDPILKYLPQWKIRCGKYLNCDNLFLSAGSNTDPDINTIDNELVQLFIEKKKENSDNWNYWKVAFLNGLFHSLSKYNPDIIIHCQSNVFLNYNFKQIIEDFRNSNFDICAPRVSSHWGHAIETGFIMLKKSAAIKYITQPLRQCFSEINIMCVEKELLNMFTDSWLNPFPVYHSFRKTVETEDGRIKDRIDQVRKCYNISDKNFYSLPLIIGPKHCSYQELDKWLEINKLKE